MRKLCRLLARAQRDGEVREAGYQFVMEAGEIGPYKTMGAFPRARNESLYEEVRAGQPGYREFELEEAQRQFALEEAEREKARKAHLLLAEANVPLPSN
jgi:hypothetical protein